jgi:hypothetical protein
MILVKRPWRKENSISCALIAICPSVVMPPFIPGRPESPPYCGLQSPPFVVHFAVCRPRSPFVDSFPHSLTVCSPGKPESPPYCGLLTGWKARPTVSTAHRPSRRLSLASVAYPAACRLRPAVHIRLFVPPFVDGLPSSPSYSLHRPSSISQSAICGLHSLIRSPIR